MSWKRTVAVADIRYLFVVDGLQILQIITTIHFAFLSILFLGKNSKLFDDVIPKTGAF